MNHLKFIKTNDGSFTIYNEILSETYHSVHGALEESRHVYIKNGLNLISKNEINILEIGLGTGLNLSLTLDNQLGKIINYTAIEPYMLSYEIWKTYTSLFENYQFQNSLNEIYQNPSFFNEYKLIETQFNFKLLIEKIEKINFENNTFDLIYFDAFAPSKQSEIWNKEVLQKMYDFLIPKGILITYCAQGEFKRNLKTIGFKIENPKGPFQKREITLAIK